MAVLVEIPYHTIWSFPQNRSDVFKYFADLDSALTSHFPGLNKVKALGNEQYVWEFEPIEHSGFKLDFRFNTQIKVQPEEAIECVPTGGGTGQLQCSWKFKEAKGCEVEYRAKLSMDLPVPGLFKSMATSLAQKEITKLFERYSASVTKKFKS